MAMSTLAIDVLTMSPCVGRVLLRSWLRLTETRSGSRHWVAETLKRRLVPAKSTRRERLSRGLWIDIDVSNAIGREIYFHGTSEPGLLRFFQRALKSGMNVIDAGANIGELTLHAARLVGPSGRVIAVEASPTTVARLRDNIGLNRMSQVSVIEGAVCDANGSCTFHLGSGSDSGASSLTPPHDVQGCSVTVSAVRLDTIVATHLSGRVDLIKLDIEGAELAALEGGRCLLRDQRPIVILEYHVDVARRSGWQLSDLQAFFRAYEYELKVLNELGRLQDVTLPTRMVSNVVAMPRPTGGH